MRALRPLAWILPASLATGAILSLLDGGTWWRGLLAYGLLLAAGLAALRAAWKMAGGGRALALLLLLAFALRLGLGVAFSFILPVHGNDNEMQNAGYIFRDSYQRDHQAWELASSEDSLGEAFNKSYSTDQYGGLLFTSSLLYRCLSPDLHRPWLVILLAALAAALGVGLAARAAGDAWGAKAALLIGWVLALYPESILQGSAQMREPFLMTFVAMLFLGLMFWKPRRKAALLWAGGGLAGLLFFSPGVAAAAVVVLAGWAWLSGREVRLRGWVFLGVAAILTAAFLLLSWAVSGSLQVESGPLATLVTWLRDAASWDTFLTQRASDGLQPLLDALPKALHIPLVTAYGLSQPLLPAALIAPGVWPMRVLQVFRALGWYLLLPLLIYAVRPILKTVNGRERLAWGWLWLASWGWILLSSFRAGGDQWDNPRYRVILLLFQAAVAAWALLQARQQRDPWLGRILLAEAAFLAVVSYWYLTRYTGWMPGSLPFAAILGLGALLVLAILAGGLVLDRGGGRGGGGGGRQ